MVFRALAGGLRGAVGSHRREGDTKGWEFRRRLCHQLAGGYWFEPTVVTGQKNSSEITQLVKDTQPGLQFLWDIWFHDTLPRKDTLYPQARSTAADRQASHPWATSSCHHQCHPLTVHSAPCTVTTPFQTHPTQPGCSSLANGNPTRAFFSAELALHKRTRSLSLYNLFRTKSSMWFKHIASTFLTTMNWSWFLHGISN